MSLNIFWKKEKITSGWNELVSNELSEANLFIFCFLPHIWNGRYILPPPPPPPQKLQMLQKRKLWIDSNCIILSHNKVFHRRTVYNCKYWYERIRYSLLQFRYLFNIRAGNSLLCLGLPELYPLLSLLAFFVSTFH